MHGLFCEQTADSSMIWLFDLDNTLHNASFSIYPKISENMNAYFAEKYGEEGKMLTPEEADGLRIDFWKRFGATLLGVSRVYDQNARNFLERAHRFEDLDSMIYAERGLAALFRSLPGRKILLTNSANRYSKEVLGIMGLLPFFDSHISIESMRVHGKLEPKPSRKFFRKLLTREKVLPSECILVEDNSHILKEAKSLGIRTVLVTQYLNASRDSRDAYPVVQRKVPFSRPRYVDLKISSVRQLSRRLNRIH